MERNQVTDNNYAQCELFNAWRQVVEVMMTSSGSHDVLQSDSRMALLFELLHDLLLKVVTMCICMLLTSCYDH